jgi:PIN domain nuclease of toxin-antitoxin system
LKLLLDTHIWLWSLVDQGRLGRRVRAALSRDDSELWLSPMSVWEVLILAERHRIRIDADPGRWVADAFARTPAQEAPLTFDVAVRSREVLPSHPDPVDRFLVATALSYDLTLVTADSVLQAAKACPVLRN